METQESTLTLALMTEPARVRICRALLEAGEAGLPATDLAQVARLSLGRAGHVFSELCRPTCWRCRSRSGGSAMC
ncbi:protein of unknown function [Cupriavidus neocaledonicus]|uniref:Uncharacterized protein n=1 Tax=Cupriavidus neocaledonicus TaxID=1040979 RepID=A0A375H672_9BURK|nr:protein of unknown function [Cupriavidus neocaledonicus]